MADVYTTEDSWAFDAVVGLTTNAVRKPNPLEELRRIETLLDQGASEGQIAKATGMPLGTIRKRLKLKRLAPELRAALDEGRVAVSVAEQAAKLTKTQQRDLAAQDGPITAATVKDKRQVQVQEIVALWPDPTTSGVPSQVSDVELVNLIEFSPSPQYRLALRELQTYRALFAPKETHHADGDTPTPMDA
jgi:hypothetical protein